MKKGKKEDEGKKKVDHQGAVSWEWRIYWRLRKVETEENIDKEGQAAGIDQFLKTKKGFQTKVLSPYTSSKILLFLSSIKTTLENGDRWLGLIG